MAEHQKLYDKPSKMILSPQMKAFDLDDEPDAMRDAYGAPSSARAACWPAGWSKRA